MGISVEIIENSSEILANHSRDFLKKRSCALATVETMSEIVGLVSEVIFPGYLGDSGIVGGMLKNHIAINLEKIYNLLLDQVDRALKFEENCPLEQNSHQIAEQFIESITDIKSMLITDVEAMYKADPAATSYGEVVFCYPSIVAMIHHRIAHRLYELKVPIIPRIISEIAHSKTGIDIHPAAQIGRYFAIDHGTGVVIGETTIIGENVVIYQGVTLGAKGFRYDENGNIINIPRHPIIEDNVKIYSNSSILGRITVGHDSVIGGNVWIDCDVEPYSKIIQAKETK
ncbi:MAG: serine O-acetyltransferase EpsC [Rikenellaceae bacterium]